MLRLLLYLTAVVRCSSSMQLCRGDNQCALCTVTGPAVVDVHGQLTSVQDRCAYTLMRTPSIPDFQVFANFKERHRKDVSFLDSVILRLDKSSVSHINLEQGGRVLLDDTVMTLNATAQLVHGVQLSKDLTGVTAKMSQLNHTVSVFFDGYTAQIHITGPSGEDPSVEGLCGNSSVSLRDVRLSDYSPDSCETLHRDATNCTIDCNTMTQRCNLMKETPFAACHSHIKPEPYVAACTDTLCKYPAVDDLNCQFLEAYSRACSLYSDDALDGWRSKANCSAGPQAFCQDRYCSSHEFCGKNSVTGETRCYCRTIFASTYTSENSLGDPVVCNGSSHSVALVGCLLEDKGILYSDLHLYDTTCRGEMDDDTHMVTFSFDSSSKPCGTMIRMNDDSEIINKNSILVGATGAELLDLVCPFFLPETIIDFAMALKIIPGSSSSTSVQYVTTGVWNYTLTMAAYTDAGRTQAVDSNTVLQLNQRVWFEMMTHGLDNKTVALVTDSCFATNEPSVSATLRYDLIMSGCANPADENVLVESNGEGAFNYFSFNMFQFTGKTGRVYLHCRLKLCLIKNDTCTPVQEESGSSHPLPSRNS
ncbi:alpha-tectorin-like [Mugil cephalus]|uniref:alpha-tectorin-like n=1 Tax=Mugil cephalus TaxID=48193 RepID=UPI001FB6B4B2|nr:alpha-tectorin-like [Mugil cephalus]